MRDTPALAPGSRKRPQRGRNASQTVFRGRVFSVARHEAVEPGGIPVVRDIIHHSGSAVILPTLEDGSILLVRQFRLAAGQSLWELPAGTRNRGETALATARRELAEETGYRASSWRKLLEFYPSPGILDETMTLFLAQKVRPGAASPEGDERIRVESFTRAQWQGMMQSGQIRDGKTLVGLLYWQWLESQDSSRAARVSKRCVFNGKSHLSLPESNHRSLTLPARIQARLGWFSDDDKEQRWRLQRN